MVCKIVFVPNWFETSTKTLKTVVFPELKRGKSSTNLDLFLYLKTNQVGPTSIVLCRRFIVWRTWRTFSICSLIEVKFFFRKKVSTCRENSSLSDFSEKFLEKVASSKFSNKIRSSRTNFGKLTIFNAWTRISSSEFFFIFPRRNFDETVSTERRFRSPKS